MELALIVAVAKNGVIGKDGTLPWHVSEDLKHFKAVTNGHAIVMGRKTFESIGRPLPGRLNVVVSRTLSGAPSGTLLAPSLEAAVEFASLHESEYPGPAFVIGGSSLYVEAMRYVQRMYITEIDRAVAGDTFFPSYDKNVWTVTEERRGETPDVTFKTLTRR